jgi:ABC-2 type transport system ATP-binding protein
MIEARDLTKQHGSTLAVDRLSFTVRPGTMTGFLGPNGSGKSTTTRLIMGLDAPDGGRARNGGIHPENHRPADRVGSRVGRIPRPDRAAA